MTRDDVFSGAQRTICSFYDVPREEIAGDTLLASLPGDSLTVIEVVMTLEDRFEIEVEDGAIAEWKTFGDVVTYLCKQLGIDDEA